MKKVYVYPASFAPPTYGHLATVRKATEIVPQLTLVYSINPEKDNWFSEEERAEMWSTYSLPENVDVRTFSGMSQEAGGVDFRNLAMVRGIRNEVDYDYEKKVAFYNRDKFGITNFLYFMADPATSHISSTLARKSAADLDLVGLANCVSPMVASILLEKTLEINRLYLVVGKTGSGKSTFCKMMDEADEKNYHINTDVFTPVLKPMLIKKFGDVNLVKFAADNPEAVAEVIADRWLELLRVSLRSVPAGSNVFLEIPYAFQQDKRLYRNLGGRSIYVGCENEENYRRVIGRGTPRLVDFIDVIPGWEETYEVAVANRLELTRIDSSCTVDELREKARAFNNSINERGRFSWTTFSFASF